MAGIHVYNRLKETHSGPTNFRIFRPSVLGNPYTHITEKKTKAKFICSSRDEAIDKYSEYFDLKYGRDIAFTEEVDRIYDLYKRGYDVYLECYCAPERCHGDIIKAKLRQRLVNEQRQARQNEKVGISHSASSAVCGG